MKGLYNPGGMNSPANSSQRREMTYSQEKKRRIVKKRSDVQSRREVTYSQEEK